MMECRLEELSLRVKLESKKQIGLENIGRVGAKLFEKPGLFQTN